MEGCCCPVAAKSCSKRLPVGSTSWPLSKGFGGMTNLLNGSFRLSPKLPCCWRPLSILSIHERWWPVPVGAANLLLVARQFLQRAGFRHNAVRVLPANTSRPGSRLIAAIQRETNAKSHHKVIVPVRHYICRQLALWHQPSIKLLRKIVVFSVYQYSDR